MSSDVMSFDQFAELVARISLSGGGRWLEERQKDLVKSGLQAKWCIGGMTGGSCYGGEPDEQVSPEPEADLLYLDAVLEQVAENMTFMQYRQLRSLASYQERSEREYYGNYTVYAVRTLPLRALYDFLVDGGWLKVT